MDWRFLYNRYVNHIRVQDGYRWDYPNYGMLLSHDEGFLDDVILKWGDSFVDVGANVGAWTVRASQFYQNVYAYEPNLDCFKSLQRNIKLNHRGNVHAFNFALDNRNGMMEESVLAPASPEKPMQSAMVVTQTLDAQIINDLAVLKIDAEGAAKRIIQGGLQTILNRHPRIIVEVHTKEESTISEYLTAYEWEKRYRSMPHTGDWLYRENNQQVFLVGSWK